MQSIVGDGWFSLTIHAMLHTTAALIQRWKSDPGGTYRTWFLWEERIKNFRSIRTGLAEVVHQIEAGTFGNVYKGSSLETVVHSIAEQRQIFKGADHAFLWKPKLRIPDIYESDQNQRAFARFLHACACCDTEQGVLSAIHNLDECRIKGLGPAAANLLYFLHPTLVPPFNTAIVNGYNALTGSKVKLGRWDEYLAMRAGILRLNADHRQLLSNDLGAIAGLLFDLGQKRYEPPPRDGDAAAILAWEKDLAKIREESTAAKKARATAAEDDATHTQVQGWLRDLGLALGFDVWIAANDHNRLYEGVRLCERCLPSLPESIASMPGIDAVRLIDVLWLSRDAVGADSVSPIAAAFEVEHTTSIYSGIVRLLDLALGTPQGSTSELFIVAPDARESDVREQVCRPAFSRIGDLAPRFLPYGELAKHRDTMGRFGHGLKAVEAISKTLI